MKSRGGHFEYTLSAQNLGCPVALDEEGRKT